jgi:hypothetical protein
MKENHNKFATEMDYNGFVRWAIEYIMDRFLDKGLTGIRNGVEMVIQQAAMNEVFGGKRKT